MKKSLIIAAVLVLLGAMIFAGAVMHLGWDFSKLSTVKYETAEHTPVGEYKDIFLKTDTANVTFAPSADGKTKVICYEEENAKHTVSVVNNTLTVQIKNNKKWYEYIGIHFGTPKLTVYLPQGEYDALTVKTSTGDVHLPSNFSFNSVDIRVSTGHIETGASASGRMKLRASTGDITLENLSAGSLEVAVSTGKIIALDVSCQGNMAVNVSTGKAALTNVECENFTSTGDTGDLHMENVIAAEGFSIERSTGDVEFGKCDAAQITVVTDTGHIKGSLLSDKVFITKTDTGRIEVPHTATGGKCQLTTDTGNIKIEISH